MSSNVNIVPRGQLSGRQLIQPSEYEIQNRLLAGARIPPITNNMSANYVGGRLMVGNNKSLDASGLSQPSGLIMNPRTESYITNVSGMIPYSSSRGSMQQRDLSLPPIPPTPMYNLTGFTDRRQLGLTNEGDLYSSNTTNPNTMIGRMRNASNKYTSLLDGIEQQGGMIRRA
jgi:hypothetical protein